MPCDSVVVRQQHGPIDVARSETEEKRWGGLGGKRGRALTLTKSPPRRRGTIRCGPSEFQNFWNSDSLGQGRAAQPRRASTGHGSRGHLCNPPSFSHRDYGGQYIRPKAHTRTRTLESPKTRGARIIQNRYLVTTYHLVQSDLSIKHRPYSLRRVSNYPQCSQRETAVSSHPHPHALLAIRFGPIRIFGRAPIPLNFATPATVSVDTDCFFVVALCLFPQSDLNRG